MSSCCKRQSGETREFIKSEQIQHACTERFEPVIRWLNNRPSVTYIYILYFEGKYLEMYLKTLQKYLNTVIKYILRNIFRYSE